MTRAGKCTLRKFGTGRGTSGENRGSPSRRYPSKGRPRRAPGERGGVGEFWYEPEVWSLPLSPAARVLYASLCSFLGHGEINRQDLRTLLRVAPMQRRWEPSRNWSTTTSSHRKRSLKIAPRATRSVPCESSRTSEASASRSETSSRPGGPQRYTDLRTIADPSPRSVPRGL